MPPTTRRYDFADLEARGLAKEISWSSGETYLQYPFVLLSPSDKPRAGPLLFVHAHGEAIGRVRLDELLLLATGARDGTGEGKETHSCCGGGYWPQAKCNRDSILCPADLYSPYSYPASSSSSSSSLSSSSSSSPRSSLSMSDRRASCGTFGPISMDDLPELDEDDCRSVHSESSEPVTPVTPTQTSFHQPSLQKRGGTKMGDICCHYIQALDARISPRDEDDLLDDIEVIVRECHAKIGNISRFEKKRKWWKL